MNLKLITVLLALTLLTAVFASCSTAEPAVSNDESADASIAESDDTASEASEISEISEEESIEESKDPGYTQPRGGYKVTVKKTSDSAYTFTSYIFDDQKTTLGFNQKSWGTFILGSWTLATENGRVDFTGGSTDMEYVYRAGKDSSGWVWSGGNHGNESLVSLEFYNGDELINFDETKSVECDAVTVIQKTTLNWGDVGTYYAEVTRKYTITAEQILLDCDYNYVLDCYHWMSYTCMFPICKEYGLYADFYSGTELLGSCETSKIGKSDYSGPFYKGYAADRVVMRGYVDDKYKVEATIRTVDTSANNFNNASKTMYWDMNTSQNKLYFTKYNENTPTLVKAGTQFTTSCSWLLIKDEG